jgi:hypothetical protein
MDRDARGWGSDDCRARERKKLAQLVLWRRMVPKRHARDGERGLRMEMDACDGAAEAEARVFGCLGA